MTTKTFKPVVWVCGFGCHRDNRFKDLSKTHPVVYNNSMKYKNNGVTYYEALKYIGIDLPKPK